MVIRVEEIKSRIKSFCLVKRQCVHHVQPSLLLKFEQIYSWIKIYTPKL